MKEREGEREKERERQEVQLRGKTVYESRNGVERGKEKRRQVGF